MTLDHSAHQGSLWEVAYRTWCRPASRSLLLQAHSCEFVDNSYAATAPGEMSKLIFRFPWLQGENNIQVPFWGISPWCWPSWKGWCVASQFPAFLPRCAEGRKLVSLPFHLQVCSFTPRQNIIITFCLAYWVMMLCFAIIPHCFIQTSSNWWEWLLFVCQLIACYAIKDLFS